MTSPPAHAARVMQAVDTLLRHHARVWEDLEVEQGINEAQARVLAAIEAGARQVSAVAGACGRHVSTASRLVDQLVRSGHVDRVEDPEDRRAVLLSLTAQGADVLRAVEAHQSGKVAAALADLDPAVAGRVADALVQLAAAVDRVDPIADDEGAATTAMGL